MDHGFKFKEGDKVRICDDLIVNRLYDSYGLTGDDPSHPSIYFVDQMSSYMNKEAIIMDQNIYEGCVRYYRLDIDDMNFMWTESMLKPCIRIFNKLLNR